MSVFPTVLGILAFLGLGTGGYAATAPTRIVIAHAAMNARVAPLWVAQEQGLFAKYGIDVEMIFVRGAPTLVAAMTSGDIEVGYTGGTAVMGAAVGGADLKILASFTNRVTYDLLARPGIKNPEDLRGKRFGVQSIGGTVWMGAILGLEYLGLEPERDKISILVVGDQTVLAQALMAGTIDATVLDGVFSHRLHERGFPILAEFSKANIPILSFSVVARDALIQKRSSALESVLKALLEGNAYLLTAANKASTLKVIQRRLKVNEREAEEGYKDIVIGMDRKPYPSLEAMRNIQRLMKLRNPKMEKVRVEELIDDRILRKLDESGFIDRLYSAYGVK